MDAGSNGYAGELTGCHMQPPFAMKSVNITTSREWVTLSWFSEGFDGQSSPSVRLTIPLTTAKELSLILRYHLVALERHMQAIIPVSEQLLRDFGISNEDWPSWKNPLE